MQQTYSFYSCFLEWFGYNKIVKYAKEESELNYAEESLRLHSEWKGKIEVVSRVPVKSKEDLSLAYTPGVAQPCLEI